MNFFKKTEGIVTLEDKFKYVKNHYSYPGWEGPYVIANNIKIYNLNLTNEQKENAYKIIEDDFYWNDLEILTDNSRWKNRYGKYGYKICGCGRSGGYLGLDVEKKHFLAKNTLNYIYGYPPDADIWSDEEHDNEFELLREYYHEEEYGTKREIEKQFKHDIEYEFKLVTAFDEYCDNLRDTFISLTEDEAYLKVINRKLENKRENEDEYFDEDECEG